jgi:hypothetical protein
VALAERHEDSNRKVIAIIGDGAANSDILISKESDLAPQTSE